MYDVVFYSDSVEFGGHEKMAIAAHIAIRRRFADLRIEWLVSKPNSPLVAALNKAGLQYTVLADARGRPLGGFRRILAAAKELRRRSPDLVLGVQGNIALSFGGAISSRFGGVPYCSYIPMLLHPSHLTSIRRRVVARLLLPFLYRAISSYLTIDREIARELHRLNPSASVIVVENYVPEFNIPDRQENAAPPEIPSGRKVLTLAGRIVFSHKCQDWLVKELKNDPFLDDKFVLFVGDGPDRRALEAMLTPELRGRFGLVDWRSDLSQIYSVTDVLVIPSRNEGVPLVMLEALGHRIPVVGTDQAGMRSWLPPEWRFAWGDTKAFKRAVELALAGTPRDPWTGLGRRLGQVHDEDRFALQFRQALARYASRTAADGTEISDRSFPSRR